MSESPSSTPDTPDPKADAGSADRGPEDPRNVAREPTFASARTPSSAPVKTADGTEGDSNGGDFRKEKRKELREDVKAWQAGVAILATVVGLPTSINAVRAIFVPAKPPPPIIVAITTPTPAPTPVPVPPQVLTEAEKLEAQKLRNELAKARPQFQVTYLLVPLERFGVKEAAGDKKKETGSEPSQDHLGPFEDALTVENLISAYASKLQDPEGVNQNTAAPEWAEKDIDWTTTIAAAAQLRGLARAGELVTRGRVILCLQLTELGSRPANDLELTVRHFAVPGAVDVHDVSVLTTDQWIASRGPAAAEQTETFTWNTIAPGGKVLIPLGIVEDVESVIGEEVTKSKPGSWKLLRGNLYLPVQLKYQDPYEDQPGTWPIRKMKANPVLTLSGIETRG